MRLCFHLIEFGICDVPGAPGFLETLNALSWVLERRIAPFPGFVEDVREEGLLAVRSDLRVYRILCKRGEC